MANPLIVMFFKEINVLTIDILCAYFVDCIRLRDMDLYSDKGVK